MPERSKRSRLTVNMYALDGAPRITHIWSWESLDERFAIRAKSYADGIWPPKGGPEQFPKRRRRSGYLQTQLAIAEMEKNKSGHVLQITTSLVDHAISGVPSVLASLTKGGLNAATKSLAIEYAKTGIRANAVSPGAIKSPMHASETHEALGALHPVGHMGEMSDIVNAVLYLDSAPFVTGEILHVDGGQSAGH